MIVHYFVFNLLFCGICKQNRKYVAFFVILFKMICHEMLIMSCFPCKFILVFYFNTEGIKPTLFYYKIILENNMLYITVFNI